MNDIYDVIEKNEESYILENGKQDIKLEELKTNPLRKRGDKPKKYLFLYPRPTNHHLKRSLEDSTNSKVEYIPIKSKLINHIYEFRYPVSTGKGIDIYVIDTGINTDHEDFDKYEGTEDERIVTCDAVVDEIDLYLTNCYEKEYRFGIYDPYDISFKNPYHGIQVASVAAGKIHGVAKKANIHAIATDLSVIGTLRAFDYILLNAEPHKTIINISFGGKTFYRQSDDDKLAELVEKGFIIFTSTGNESVDCCAPKGSKDFRAFTGYRKAINVGVALCHFNLKEYAIEYYSNYGDCVDIFAPGHVTTASTFDSSRDLETEAEGTSFTSPMMVSVASSIMAENLEYEFDSESMRKVLIELAVKGSVENLDLTDTPNRFLNNGKNIINSSDDDAIECGVDSVNKASCPQGCCTKDGKCALFPDNPGEKCLIENGCQRDYGFYFGHSKYNMYSIARSFKDFGIINTIYMQKSKRYSEYCNSEIYEKYLNKCTDEVSSYRKCLIDRDIFDILLDDSGNLKEIDLNMLGEDKLEKLQNDCINFRTDDCVDFELICTNKIKEYDDCLPVFTNTPINEEFRRNCSLYKSDKCQSFYEAENYFIPLCNTYSPEYEKLELLNNFEDTVNNYKTICEIEVEDEIKEEAISNCINELQNNECLFDYTPGMKNQEVFQHCKTFKTEKCQEKYSSSPENIDICRLARLYDDDDDKVKSILAESKEKFVYNDYLCNFSKDEIINKCEESLNNLDYTVCIPGEEEDLPDDVYYNCLLFNEEFCQNFYENPYKEIPECVIAERYQSFNIISKSDKKWNYYYNNCPRIIEEGSNAEIYESTQTIESTLMNDEITIEPTLISDEPTTEPTLINDEPTLEPALIIDESFIEPTIIAEESNYY
ncbi:subtilisin-like protein [Neocallimastix lanati (nom. inval.)]|uniref:Subtilisin-like protein n=1 Tax=Neocallimastix californiae TaxID=1754190 RepID=A0A1Y2CKJ1_9FUNG|nr:subtilisin-like protein [Neocallimastix sp. JGI-2020a]ORY47510.1 subtilisin-like protein [Neocallimastix californiae]|eukprot:ORY47510.1 subtilisin-like protein [Neocallimastix californiae]